MFLVRVPPGGRLRPGEPRRRARPDSGCAAADVPTWVTEATGFVSLWLLLAVLGGAVRRDCVTLGCPPARSSHRAGSPSASLVQFSNDNRAIAARLHVTPKTVRKHLENSYAKLGVHSWTAAVAVVFGN